MARLYLQAAVAAVLLPVVGCVIEPGESPFDFGGSPAASAYDDDDDPSPEAEPGEASPRMIAFVTTLQYTADLGGIEGADEICAFAAEAAELRGTFRAWISTTSADAIDRITGEGPWHDAKGQRLFNNHAHLRTSPLAPLVVDPFGERIYAGSVWTGTGVGGRLTGDSTCGDWTTEDPFADAAAGYMTDVERWTDGGPSPCEWERHLYCFQVE